MGNNNPCFDINKLALYGAIIVLLGDFVALLVAYQQYCDSLINKGDNNKNAPVESQSQIDLRLRQAF